MTHAKARLTPAGRHLLVQRVLVEGWAPAHVAVMAGVSRQTVQKWIGRFRDEGLTGLQNHSSVAHRCPRRSAPEVERAVLELRTSLRRGPIASPRSWTWRPQPCTRSWPATA